jgi:energy-coupling factor transport system permease protein
MSQFEYLRNISIGQYMPLSSGIHRLDPRVKLLVFSFLVLAISLTNQVAGLLFGLALAGVLMAASRTPLTYALRGWLSALPFLLILAALQIFIVRPAAQGFPLIEIIGVHIYLAGLLAAARLLLRFTVLMAILTVASISLSSLETIHAMHLLLKPLRWIGLNPTPAVMVVQIMLRFIPFLALSAEKIAKSQASRGANWDGKKGGLIARAKRILPLIVPLFINSLRQAETLADAMLARGFDGKRQRTSMQEYKIGLLDVLFMLGALTSALVVLFPGWINV